MKLKSKIFLLMPLVIRKLIRRLQFYLSVNKFRGKSAKEIFENIYQNNRWGSLPGHRFYSGAGTHSESILEEYTLAIKKYFKKSKIDLSVLKAFDCGCGDFTCGRKLEVLFSHYTGGDIYPDMIKNHRYKYTTDEIKFIDFDLSKDPLPDCDVIICRQVLQHLPNDMISSFVQKLNNWTGYLIFTDHQPSSRFVPNKDSNSFEHIRLDALGSGLLLHEPPFELVHKSVEIISETHSGSGCIRTYVYQI